MQVYFELLVTRSQPHEPIIESAVYFSFAIRGCKSLEKYSIVRGDTRSMVRNNVYKWYWYVDIMFSFFL